jgi:hypothetical protein
MQQSIAGCVRRAGLNILAVKGNASEQVRFR